MKYYFFHHPEMCAEDLREQLEQDYLYRVQMAIDYPHNDICAVLLSGCQPDVIADEYGCIYASSMKNLEIMIERGFINEEDVTN